MLYQVVRNPAARSKLAAEEGWAAQLVRAVREGSSSGMQRRAATVLRIMALGSAANAADIEAAGGVPALVGLLCSASARAWVAAMRHLGALAVEVSAARLAIAAGIQVLAGVVASGVESRSQGRAALALKRLKRLSRSGPVVRGEMLRVVPARLWRDVGLSYS